MLDLAISPLSAVPTTWTEVQMWGFVNSVNEARQLGGLKDGVAILAVRGEYGARPINLKFSRPARVAEYGWSWDNHYHDEQAEVLLVEQSVTICLSVGADKILLSRCMVLLALARLFADACPESGKSFRCSLGDSDGDQPVLCFSSKTFDNFLIPDPYFMLTRSYERERSAILENWKSPELRDSRFYWRGAPSGLAKYTNQLDSQRVKLVLMANDVGQRSAFNVRFANRSGLEEPVAARLDACGGFGPPEDQMEIVRYAFNLDVDGVSSSWTGFFLRLLSGGAVVKIASDSGYRQWFYARLQPWVHFAEVSADLGDLCSVSRVLRLRPDWALQIGEAGRELALSLDLASQLSDGVAAVGRAIAAQN